jgi:proteasome lid subunit RPN8/RPN11
LILVRTKKYCIHSSVLNNILRLTCKYLGVENAGPYLGLEVSGLLLGLNDYEKIVINSFLTGDQRSEPFYTSMSDDFLASVANKISTHEISGKICGWFHSHPGIDVAFSSRDFETQINLQRLSPDAVALVVNPLKKERFRFYKYNFSTEELCSVNMLILDDR